MSKQTEALKLALEALEAVTKEMLAIRDEIAERGGRPKTNAFHQRLWDSSFAAYTDKAIPAAEAIREALAAVPEAHKQPAQEQEVDWEKLYRLEVKKKEALAVKYERDTGKKLTRIVPMAEQPAHPLPGRNHWEDGDVFERIGAMKKQPAQQQEPFGYFKPEPFGWTDCAETDEGAIALYDRPPASKPWVGLTDVEWQEIDASLNGKRDLARIFVRAIEAKLKEKNA